MSTLSVSRLLSDHMVLQYGKSIHFWGTASSGTVVRAAVYPDDSASREGSEPVNAGETVAGPDGSWSMMLSPMRPGYDRYLVKITDALGGRILIRDVVVGAVWYASGQSNMDLMMTRAQDLYPEEILGSDRPFIRSFKIAEHTDYHGPLTEPETGEWVVASPETILEFSASAWFFSRFLQEEIDMPVGYLHASLGGSHVAGWMSAGMLSDASPAAPEGYPAFLEEAQRYADDSFVADRIRNNEEITASWEAELHRLEAAGSGQEKHGTVRLPCFFRDLPELRGFVGSLSLKRTFTLTPQMIRDAEAAGSRIRLFLGTMVDRDVTSVNGKQVGETGYQYPPRKYEIPVSVLHAGENEIEIRLIVEKGLGRVTPGKDLMIFCEKANEKVNVYTHEGFFWCVDLSGEWEYQVHAVMPEVIGDLDFINWHPTGLYNGMTAPCHAWPIEGILWYQGESDADLRMEDGAMVNYTDLLCRMIRGYRREWKEEQLPFLIVQLPNFTVDLTEEESWPAIRRMQEACLAEPHTGMICAIDLGEDNDLHPIGKKEIGRRLARLALSMIYRRDIETSGPSVKKAVHRQDAGNGSDADFLDLFCEHALGLTIKDIGKGTEVLDFKGITQDGQEIPLTMHGITGSGDVIRLILPARQDIREVRYLDSNTYHGGVFFNSDGYPMAPFTIDMEQVPDGD